MLEHAEGEVSSRKGIREKMSPLVTSAICIVLHCISSEHSNNKSGVFPPHNTVSVSGWSCASTVSLSEELLSATHTSLFRLPSILEFLCLMSFYILVNSVFIMLTLDPLMWWQRHTLNFNQTPGDEESLKWSKWKQKRVWINKMYQYVGKNEYQPIYYQNCHNNRFSHFKILGTSGKTEALIVWGAWMKCHCNPACSVSVFLSCTKV